MAFDACMMRAVIGEINRSFPDAKIEKVLQPANDEIDLVIHSGRKSGRLLFNVGPNAPRMGLTSVAKENPLKAPMFCMLLRKLLAGARIVGCRQLGFDRIAVFDLSCYDEMGYPTTRRLICEIMGKYANLVITDGDYKIINALKLIDFAASSVRQVLPGLKYQIPAIADRILPTEAQRAEFFVKLAEFPRERSVEKLITSTYSGVATQIAHELCFRAAGGIDVPTVSVDPDRLWAVISDWSELLRTEQYTPTSVLDAEGEPIDYSYMDITYRGRVTKKTFDSFEVLFDSYFAEKDRLEKIHQRGKDLTLLINNAIARTERKLSLQRETLAGSEKGEEYKRQADLITANIYALKRGMDSFSAVDYYSEDTPTVVIPLDTRLSPAANAQRMYKLYNKAKNAKVILTEQIAIWEAELRYLESVREFLSRAETEEDIGEIREELYRSGYGARMKGYRPPKQIRSRPMRLTTSGGYTLLVGRNNMQNDNLTMKLAAKDDIWFHTKDIPGSHVILVTDGEEPSDIDYTEACAVAAHFSKAKGDNVAVDYTRVKNIRKPQGSKPGFVTYKTNYTAFVTPMTKEEIEKHG